MGALVGLLSDAARVLPGSAAEHLAAEACAVGHRAQQWAAALRRESYEGTPP